THLHEPPTRPTGAHLAETIQKSRLTRIDGIDYGTPQANSLHLIRYYYKEYFVDAKEVVLSIKGAFDMEIGPDGSPEGSWASVEEAVKVLGGSKTTRPETLGR
ncbi:MAG: hypothetical protein LQ338_008302, partial [Usnochroma carphineum]